MERKEFYEKKVLTDQEYETINDGFARAEDACNDVMDNLKVIISNVMAKLLEKKGCSELTTANYTIVNRDGVISVIDELVKPLESINSVDMLMNIVSEII